MTEYLEFKKANCRDCYKCLRECPVKAIKFEDNQAQLIADRCILCGECTLVCHQNAKRVHSDLLRIENMLLGGPVVASVAPSFVTSLKIDDFGILHAALLKLGFADAEETSIGANVVIQRYTELLESGKYPNLISSCCTSVNLLIRQYYPQALTMLAPVDTPMVTHAKMIKEARPAAKVVFIGPCLSKKWEADESNGAVDGVLTFEDLLVMLTEKQISLSPALKDPAFEEKYYANRAKYFPIDRGVIKSFKGHPGGYEFIGVSGTKRVMNAMEKIDKLNHVFLELNACEYGCINGPCSIKESKNELEAIAEVRKYVGKSIEGGGEVTVDCDLALDTLQTPIKTEGRTPSPREIEEVLHKIGKYTPADELNCSSCGYSSCREKAWAVVNGYAELEMCLPYMRERAESMSGEIIKNSPNGIVLVDNELKIMEINDRARELLGITAAAVKGSDAFEYMDATDFILAQNEGRDLDKKVVEIKKTGRTVELSITLLREHKLMFAILKDITQEADYDRRLRDVKLETLATTDEVIKKQMRVAQEIASLLGETTAETKVALLKLKKTLTADTPEDK